MNNFDAAHRSHMLAIKGGPGQPLHKIYERPANMMKDLAYGGLVSSGVWERAFLDIHDEKHGVYRIECNVLIVENNGDPFFEDRTKVLKLFGRQYQRLLRQVKRKLD